MEWRLINTAPKDHKDSFLIYDAFHKEVREAEFKYENNGVAYFGDPIYSEWECHTPTHWMPKPKPPKD